MPDESFSLNLESFVATPEREYPRASAMDLTKGAGTRCWLVERPDGHDLVVQMHHTVTDALGMCQFIEDVLVRRLHVRWVLVGEDFRFGKGRTGDIATLRAAAKSFSVEAMRTVSVENERASSTAVRHALSSGNFAHAAALLGRRFTIAGRVAHGAKLGRTLGYPTANIRLKRMPPVSGVFAVRVHGLGKSPLPGAASVGVRPTVTDAGEPLLEVFIFDFDQQIYGRRVVVEFLHKLRDEERLPDLDVLARRIGADVADARAYFAGKDPVVELAAR